MGKYQTMGLQYVSSISIRLCSAWTLNMLEIVRHEAAQKMRVWPLGAGLQEQASKHLKLLWSKAMVVSVEEKVSQKGSVVDQRDERKRTIR